MSLKSHNRTAQRIIKMVEVGDYEIETIEHMLESLVINRDKRIKKLETKAKPRKFDISLARITGALKDTINAHGPITSLYIPSAAKRIYGICQQVENIQIIERSDDATVTVVREKNTTHTLTVAADGNIRIKIAIGTSIDDANYIIEKLTFIAVDALRLNKGTLRGKLNPKKDMTSITLANDSKTDKINFKL